MVLPSVSRACMSTQLWQLLYQLAGHYTPNERLRAAIVEAALMGMVDQFDQTEVDDIDALIFTTLHRTALEVLNIPARCRDVEYLVPAA